MKSWFKKTAVLTAAAFLLLGLSLQAFAATPYDNYIFDGKDAVPAPPAATPSSSMRSHGHGYRGLENRRICSWGRTAACIWWIPATTGCCA